MSAMRSQVVEYDLHLFNILNNGTSTLDCLIQNSSDQLKLTAENQIYHYKKRITISINIHVKVILKIHFI